MKAERRLARLEASLPPRGAVLRWLIDAHDHGSLDAYVGGLVADPGPSPLVALVDRVAAAARTAHVGEPRAIVREAERRAVSDAICLVVVVLELEQETIETMRLGNLRLTALEWERRARIAEGRVDRKGWATWRAAVIELATDVSRIDAVTGLLADRYLDGRESRFPDTQAGWRELHDGVSALVETMAAVPGGRRRCRADAKTLSAQTEATVDEAATRLLERARARALDLLGDHTAALAGVERALRDRT